MQYKPENYPKGVDEYKEVYGYGGVRIYQVSEDEGNDIGKEFPKSFRFNPQFAKPAEGEQLFYMNVNHGEQHFLFLLPAH
jgi:hypothetical protein